MQDIRKKIINETTIAISIATVVLGSFIYLTSPQAENEKKIELMLKDIEFIRENHLKHMEENLSEIRKDIDENQKCARENEKKLEVILTILEERNVR